jgi:hypothetical protein
VTKISMHKPVDQDRGNRSLSLTAISAGQRVGWSTYDADVVVYRLEEAGATLLALPGSGWTTHMRTSSVEIVRSALESYGWTAARIRPAVPSAEKVDRMDEAMSWLSLIPQQNYALRRVVGARSLVHPITDRHLFTWRRLGAAMGADHKAVQRWHGQGVELIVAALNRGEGARKPVARK